MKKLIKSFSFILLLLSTLAFLSSCSLLEGLFDPPEINLHIFTEGYGYTYESDVTLEFQEVVLNGTEYESKGSPVIIRLKAGKEISVRKKIKPSKIYKVTIKQIDDDVLNIVVKRNPNANEYEADFTPDGNYLIVTDNSGYSINYYKVNENEFLGITKTSYGKGPAK